MLAAYQFLTASQDKFDGALTDLVTLVSAKFGAALKRKPLYEG
jgi:hypothetical protein